MIASIQVSDSTKSRAGKPHAALNILAAGQAVSACGAGRTYAPVLKLEPAYGAAR